MSIVSQLQTSGDKHVTFYFGTIQSYKFAERLFRADPVIDVVLMPKAKCDEQNYVIEIPDLATEHVEQQLKAHSLLFSRRPLS